MAVHALRNILKSVDFHGYPIGLTYKNQPTYQTPIGGTITILSRLGVLAFFLVLVSNIVNREKIVTFKTINYSANDDNQTNPLDFSKFDFGIGLTFYDGKPHLYEKQNLEKYFDVQFTFFSFDFVEVNGTKTVKRTLNSVPYSQCQIGRFANKSSDMLIMGMDQPGWYCIDSMDFNLVGQLWGVKRSTIRLRIQTCTNSTTSNVTCATQEEIDAVMKISVMQIVLLQSHFDQDEFDGTPVKHDIVIIPMNYKMDTSYAMAIYLQKNKLTTRDFWLSNLLSNQYYEFYKVVFGPISVGVIRPNINDMFTIQLYNMEEEVIIDRRVTTLLDVLPLAGGFTNIILLFTRLISKLYSKPLLDQQIISQLYSQKQGGKKLNNSVLSLKDLENNQELSNKWMIEKILKSVQRKSPLMINAFRVAIHSFCKKIKMSKSSSKEEKFREYALGKMNKQLDIIYIVKSIRKVKTAMKLLLKNHQYALLPFTKQNYLDPNNMKPPSSSMSKYVSQKGSKAKKDIDDSKWIKEKPPFEKIIKQCINSKEELSSKILDDLLNVAGCPSKPKEKKKNVEHTKKSSRNVLENSQRPLIMDPPLQFGIKGVSKSKGKLPKIVSNVSKDKDDVVPFDY